MIVELALIDIVPGSGERFEQAAARAVDEVLSTAPGFLSFQLRRCLDTEDRYSFDIRWRPIGSNETR